MLPSASLRATAATGVSGAMLGGGPRHLGVYLLGTRPEIWVPWQSPLGAPVTCSPVVAGGTVYIGSGGCLHALDARTGVQLWKQKVAKRTPVAVSAPAVVSGVAYVGGNPCLHAISAKDGDPLWDVDLGGQVGPPTVVNGTIYVTADTPSRQTIQLHALDSRGGRQLHTLESPSWSGQYSPPRPERELSAPAVADGVLCAGWGRSEDYTGQGEIQALAVGSVRNDRGMGPLWFLDCGNPPHAVVIDGEAAYIAASRDNGAGELRKADILTGAVRWAAGGTEGAVAVAGGTVYVAGAASSKDGHLMALYATTGQLRWDTPLPGRLRGGPALSGDMVYIGSDDGHLHALNARSGTIRWSFPVTAAIRFAPVIADGAAYFGTDNGALHAIDAVTGEGHT
jgi:eukaryotic-like serine/threonine-protein kinase